jgi:large subunit ribosomal protein L21
MLYAIVESGGKQYKAVEGSPIEVDLLPDEVGKKKTFDKVMLLVDDDNVQVGTPYLPGISIDGTVMTHFKGQSYDLQISFQETLQQKNWSSSEIYACDGRFDHFPRESGQTGSKSRSTVEKKAKAAVKPAAKAEKVEKTAASTKPAAAKKPAATKKPAAKK